MKAFAAPVEDILFSLEHVADAGRLADWDHELATEIIRHFADYVETKIAPADELGDRQGARLQHGRVKMPDGFPAIYKSYAEQGWTSLTAPEAYGGQGLPSPVLAATSEIFSGANQSLQMVTGLVPGAINTLLNYGTEDQKARLLPSLVTGEWLSTMCLTEPGAGSDLSMVRTRAEKEGDAWKIFGEKIFISGGDQDLSEGILHLVLARTGTMAEGVRGLSLFVCLDKCSDGTRNAVSVARIEEKMGLHASPTCQLVFDGAEAEIIGKEGEGLKAMFTMMNHARIDVALQGVAHTARAYDIASSYASERKQGRDAKTGLPVTIDRHADIASKLTEMDMLALGNRALCHTALVTLELEQDDDLVDFLTPVCKYACTEAGIQAANMGIQVLGGYGYLHEYRVEQTFRDVRISAIYEGANGIHALTLATRMLRNRNGAAANAFDRFIEDCTKSGSLCSEVADGLALWRKARIIVTDCDNPTQLAEAFMELTSQLCLLAMWNRISNVVHLHPDQERIARLVQKARELAAARLRYWFDLHQQTV